MAVFALRRSPPGARISFSSTAFSRSAICCTTAGASSGRSGAATSTRRGPLSRSWLAATPTGWTTAACRRAAIESLSENLTDGFISPLCWYVAAGIPGLALFKVVSTMDSMVGYKTPRYLRFGWCGARLDDAMNFVPARLTFCLVAATAAVMPGYSARKAMRVGWSQHAILPGPNSGWSEAAFAGALQRRLVGPIWMHGQAVTDVWLGDPADPPLETDRDYRRASVFVTVTGIVAAIAGWVVLQFVRT